MAALVCVASKKDLRMSLLLRPFDYAMLASVVYALASEKRLEARPLAALAVALVGDIPVIIMSHPSSPGQSRRFPELSC